MLFYYFVDTNTAYGITAEIFLSQSTKVYSEHIIFHNFIISTGNKPNTNLVLYPSTQSSAFRKNTNNPEIIL